MPKLPERSIPRKLLAILAVARHAIVATPRDLAVVLAKEKRIEFSFFRPVSTGGRRLGYSQPAGIVPKVRFAISLELLDDSCKVLVDAKDVASETKAVILFAEKTKDLLRGSGVDIARIVQKSADLLSRDPLQLPTSQKLYAELAPAELSYRNFRLCLSLLLFEPDGSVGASTRRLYLPRTADHQRPGEIGD
jgi:hypothetical protein